MRLHLLTNQLSLSIKINSGGRVSTSVNAYETMHDADAHKQKIFSFKETDLIFLETQINKSIVAEGMSEIFFKSCKTRMLYVRSRTLNFTAYTHFIPGICIM